MPKAAAKKKVAKKPLTKVAARRTKPKPKRKPREKTVVTDKEKADKEAAALRDNPPVNKIDNRDQDPNHPANKTLSPEREAIPRPVAEGITVPPEEMLTEQEKAAAAGGEGAGVGPVSASEVTTGPVETIEDQGIGPRTPYPTGNPPPDTEVITRSQGINKGDQRPVNKVKPGEETRKVP